MREFNTMKGRVHHKLIRAFEKKKKKKKTIKILLRILQYRYGRDLDQTDIEATRQKP